MKTEETWQETTKKAWRCHEKVMVAMARRLVRWRFVAEMVTLFGGIGTCGALCATGVTPEWTRPILGIAVLAIPFFTALIFYPRDLVIVPRRVALATRRSEAK